MAASVDKYLDAGFIGIMVKHPITGEETESLIPTSGYTQNQPGVTKLMADLGQGSISKAHGDKSVTDIAKIVFAELVKAKGDQYLLDAMARVDKSLETAQKAAKLASWREKLDGSDFTEYQAAGKGLFASLESAKAELASVEAQIAEARKEVAEKLDIDKTFDLALVSSGWYVSEETKTKGSREKVGRDYSADTYEQNSKSINGVAVKTSAKVTARDEDGEITGATVKYIAKGKTYTGTGDTLHDAHMKARESCMAVIAPDAKSSNVNTPKWFDVPKIKLAD